MTTVQIITVIFLGFAFVNLFLISYQTHKIMKELRRIFVNWQKLNK